MKNHANPWPPINPDPSLDSLPCYFACDFLKDINESYQGKIPELPNPEQKGIIDYEPRVPSLYGMLNVTNDNEYLKVLINKSNGTVVTINVYNLIGELIQSKSGKLNIGINIFEIDISKLNSGVYLYRIIVDGFVFYNGKINIIR